jgi:hypothetical protein
VTVENAASFDTEDWHLRRFDPGAREWAGSFALIGCGLLATTLIGRVGNEDADAESAPDSTA